MATFVCFFIFAKMKYVKMTGHALRKIDDD